MYIFDTLKKKKVKFRPVDDKKIYIYLCGPTVYDNAHLGHARSAIAFDLLVRVLKASCYDVVFIRNFTDIDDKIINKAKKENKDIKTITTHYIKEYKKDMSMLNIISPDIEPKATENIDRVIELIEVLAKNNYTNTLSDGIYFDVSRDKEYLTLSKKDKEALKRGISFNEKKEDFKDFVLWKFAKEDEPYFDSPFGKGRPGWHMECSAIIDKCVKREGEYQLDIHAGGVDLIFPHHENEASQTRCARRRNITKYWMHNGFVKIDGEKMSKSLNNSFFIKDFLREYQGEVLRAYLLSTHYRLDLHFNQNDLLASKKRLDKLYRLKKRVFLEKPKIKDISFEKNIIDSLKDDLNISKALSIVDDMINKYNKKIDENLKDTPSKQKAFSNICFLEAVLGIGAKDPYEYFHFDGDKEVLNRVNMLIKQREKLKESKEYRQADKIREELEKMGIRLMDIPGKTVWERI